MYWAEDLNNPGNAHLVRSPNSLHVSNTHIGFESFSGFLKVPVVTLDQFVAENAVNAVDLLKIDVEGFEMNVIEGSQTKLGEISFILLENQFGNHFKNNNFKDITKFLSERNYIISKKFLFPTLHYQDVLFKKI